MASDYTTNFNLDKYVGTDKPNLRDQYNSAMDKIDAQLKLSSDNAALAVQTANNAASAVSGKASQSALESEISARQSADTNLSSRISTLENPTKYIATIGDSFGNESGEWAAITATKTGYQLINRCTNEAGFVYNGTDGKTFTGQLQDIKNNANFANVEYIIVYGGVNDFTMQITAASMKSSINSFMNEYNAISGKKPKLIFAFGNFGNGRRRTRAAEFPAWYNEIVNYCRTIGIPVVDYVPLWLACSDVALFNSDNLHPNSVGENVISSYIQALINGAYNGVHRRFVGTYDGPVYTTQDAEVSGTNVKYNEILTLDNGIVTSIIDGVSASVNAIDTNKFSGNTYYSLRGALTGDSYWHTFGENSAIPNPLQASIDPLNGEAAIGIAVSSQTFKQNNIGLLQIAHNFGNQQSYFKVFGSINTLHDVFSSWPSPVKAKFSYNCI